MGCEELAQEQSPGQARLHLVAGFVEHDPDLAD